MPHPFQCLASIHHRGSEHLLAACASRLLLYSLHHGEILSEWSADVQPTTRVSADLNRDHDVQAFSTKQKTNNLLHILQLVVSEDQQHVVAVTDDKSVHVLQCKDTELLQLSQRVMPKRPCAVHILPDNATLLCADKFGDVYSLPLTPSVVMREQSASGARDVSSQPHVRFKPSANNQTVHSQRNRQALEAQMKQKNFTPRKDPLRFEHELLLGHVSMLTDMTCVTDASGDSPRDYIVTADRDEHIRVSRCPPQAHIIEGFCLGHTNFISKICQVGRSEFLVSGGGDSWLGLWEWPLCKLRRKFEIMRYVRELPGVWPDDYRLAVSGVWSMEIKARQGVSNDQIVIVACEKVKALFLIPLSALLTESIESGERPSVMVVRLPAYPLALAVVGENVVVSMDVREGHEAHHRVWGFSPRKNIGTDDLVRFVLVRETFLSGKTHDESLQALNKYTSAETDVIDMDKEALLYGVANLRKRGRQEDEDGQESDGGAG